MSIIYEALKKTEKMIRRDLKVGVDTKPGRPKFKIKVIALYVLMVCLGLIIGNFVIVFLNHPSGIKVVENTPVPARPLLKEKAQIDKKVESVSKPIETTLRETKQNLLSVKEEPQKPFVLNGIFFSQDEGYALINNRIVKTGDSVAGAMVLRITADEVELNSSGATIKLTRPR